MSGKTIIKPKKFARAITDLSSSVQMLDQTSILEISRSESSSYKSYRTNLASIDEAIIEKFSLYKNLNDIFNSLKHYNQTYFNPENGKTTFLFNPYIHESTDLDSDYDDLLPENSLITKSKIYEYIEDVGFCVPVCKPDSPYFYYSTEESKWKRDESKKPKVIAYDKDGIWTSNSKLKFRYGNTSYFYTDEVKAEKNILLDAIGNIVLNLKYSDDWYELQHYFVALTIDGKVITLQFLKNILKLDKYTIAQFHLHCPIANDTKFRIVTNAPCKLFGLSSTDPFPRKLYNSLNAVNLSYYDIGSPALFNSSDLIPERDDEDPIIPPGPTPVPTENINLIVEKYWTDVSSRRPNQITMKLTSDNNTNDEYIIVTKDDGWKKTIEKPKYKKDGYTEISYSWTEITDDLPEGYNEPIKEKIANLTQFKNTYTEPSVTVSILKEWQGFGIEYPNDLSVQLFANNILKNSIKLNDENDWTYSQEVPKYIPNENTEISYSWAETKPSDYISSKQIEEYLTKITNIYNKPIEYVDLTVIKEWDDNNDAYQKRPEYVEVNLLKNNDEVSSVILSAGNNWQAKARHFEEPAAQYIWKEDFSDDHYTSSQVSLSDISTKITNKYRNLSEISMYQQVTKRWIDRDNPSSHPTEVSVKLIKNGDVIGEPIKLNDSNQWTATIDNLRKYDNEENLIDYSWEEIDQISDYESIKSDPSATSDGGYITEISNIYIKRISVSFNPGVEPGGGIPTGTMDSIPIELTDYTTVYDLPSCEFIPTDNNYIFSNWDWVGRKDQESGREGTIIEISSDTELTAQWSEYYTISFNSGEQGSDEGEMPPIKWPKGENCELPQCLFDPKIDYSNYSFSHWSWPGQTSETGKPGTIIPINSNIELTAKWKEKEYCNIVFHPGVYGDGEIPRGTMETKIWEKGTYFELPECEYIPNDENYEFAGWDLGDEGDPILVNEDIDVTALWRDIRMCRITFSPGLYGTGKMTPQDREPGTIYELPPCSFTPKEGYAFSQWDQGSPGATIMINKDIEITAQWEPVLHGYKFLNLKGVGANQRSTGEIEWYDIYDPSKAGTMNQDPCQEDLNEFTKPAKNTMYYATNIIDAATLVLNDLVFLYGTNQHVSGNLFHYDGSTVSFGRVNFEAILGTGIRSGWDMPGGQYYTQPVESHAMFTVQMEEV